MIIELPILGFLGEKPMHGYELVQRMYAVLGFVWQPSYGALYPMLRNLERRDFVGRTGETKGFGPPKQVYSLTEKGRARFRELMLTRQTPAGVPLQVLFLDLLTPDERSEVLSRIRKEKAKTLEDFERRAKKAESLSKYQRMVVDYGLKTLGQEIEWLDGLAQRVEEHLPARQ